MPSAEEHVRLAIEVLIEERHQLDLKISVLQTVLGELENHAHYVDLTPTIARTPTVSEVVLRLLEQRSEVNLAEVMQALQNAGNDARQDSVISILSRMVSEGKVEKGDYRGTWVPAGAPGERWREG